jgi:hypothetical protein
MRNQSVVAPIAFAALLLVLSFILPWYITVFPALYGIWNPRFSVATLCVLVILDCIFATDRTRFFDYPGVLTLFGCLSLALARFIRSRLASHVLT